MLTRLSHYVKDLDTHSQKHCEFYEERLSLEDYKLVASVIMELSKLIVKRIERQDSVKVREVKISYLVEKDKYDPWFIGMEYCKVEIQPCNMMR